MNNNIMPISGKDNKFSLLKEKIETCTKCKDLVECRIKTVPGNGNLNSKICIAGHSPGEEENRQGIPFVGRSGLLLNNILNKCKIKREDVFVLNPVACHTPDNRDPTEQELNNCKGFFRLQLTLINPQYIICLGAIAVKAILGLDSNISSLRGKLHDWQNKKVLVTYHPSYALHSTDEKEFLKRKQEILTDLAILINTLKGA